MNKLVLFGHSGWNCSTRDTYFNGLKVPASVAAMNIVAQRDEWLTFARRG
jgi:hypothetical protein